MVLAGILYLLAILAATLAFPPALSLFLANLVLSLFAVLLNAVDKRAAKTSRRRIPETHLHLVELLGGWPGTAVAQRLLRHKTKKREFQTAFRAAAFLNVLLTAVSLGYLIAQP